MKQLLALFAVFSLLLPSWALAASTSSVTTAAGSSTSAAATNYPTIISTSGVTFIKASSGTMGDNGAISLMTAFPRIMTNGAYLYLPAASIVASGDGSAAGWYWFVGSSTTAGTVYNSTYTSGTPVAGTLTAFVTTGPGAFTGSTSSIAGPTISIPANTLGINGVLNIDCGWQAFNSGGNKNLIVKYGTLSVQTHALSSGVSAWMHSVVANKGVANVQSSSYIRFNQANSGAGAVVATVGAQDTTTALNVTFNLDTTVATDHAILDFYSIVVQPGS